MPWPAGSSLMITAQDALGLCKGTVLTSFEFLIHLHPRLFSVVVLPAGGSPVCAVVWSYSSSVSGLSISLLLPFLSFCFQAILQPVWVTLGQCTDLVPQSLFPVLYHLQICWGCSVSHLPGCEWSFEQYWFHCWPLEYITWDCSPNGLCAPDHSSLNLALLAVFSSPHHLLLYSISLSVRTAIMNGSVRTFTEIKINIYCLPFICQVPYSL